MGAGNKALLCAHTVDQPTRCGRHLRRRQWPAYSRPTGLWQHRVRSSMSTPTSFFPDERLAHHAYNDLLYGFSFNTQTCRSSALHIAAAAAHLLAL